VNPAADLFRQYTDGTGVIDRLYGPPNAARRAEIMTAATGQTVPKSKAAWGRFRETMKWLFRVDSSGKCIAAVDREIALTACPDAWHQETDEYGTHWRLRSDGMRTFA
jgi:hypothetical protein